MDEVCINGSFLYAIKHKHLKSGRAKTEAYIDIRRMLDARFRVDCFQYEIGSNVSSPTSHFQRLRVSYLSDRKENGESGSWMFQELT